MAARLPRRRRRLPQRGSRDVLAQREEHNRRDGAQECRQGGTITSPSRCLCVGAVPPPRATVLLHEVSVAALVAAQAFP